jgi:hypothetical protein
LGELCRRPFGASVLDITSELKSDTVKDEMEHTALMSMYQIKESDEEHFFSMPDKLIKDKNAFEKVPSSMGIGVGLAMRLFHGDLETLRKERELLRNACCARPLELEAMRPGFVRHDLFVTIKRGEFQQGTKTSEKNIRITASVLDRYGREKPGAIVVGTSTVSEAYTSFSTQVLRHVNHPIMNEMFMVRVSPYEMEELHLKFEIAHLSSTKKPTVFSFAYLELTQPDKTVIKDGDYNLETFKLPAKPEGCPYISDREAFQSNNRKKETIVVHTRLCSTHVTQIKYLHDLLHWEDHKTRLTDVIKHFAYVEPEEVLKFVPQILDTLFAISFQRQQNVSLPIFHALVSLLNTVGDESKTKQSYANIFKPLLADYIEEKIKLKNADTKVPFSLCVPLCYFLQYLSFFGEI